MKPQNLKRLRISLGLTCGFCAEGMGVTRQTINNIENGKSCKASEYFYELYLKEVKRVKKYSRDRRVS
jgi:predicted transcriptional regulator